MVYHGMFMVIVIVAIKVCCGLFPELSQNSKSVYVLLISYVHDIKKVHVHH